MTTRSPAGNAADRLIAALLSLTIFTTRDFAQEMDAMTQLQTPDPVPPNLPEMPPILPELPEPKPEIDEPSPVLN